MKKYIIPALVVCAGLFASCSEDKLDIPQKGVTAIDDFYKTDADAEAALVAAYQGFNWNVTGWNGTSTHNALHFAFNLPGDDVLAAGAVPFDNDFAGAVNEFRYDNANAVVSNAYLNFIYSIFYDNLVLNYFNDETADTPVKKRCAAEARVLRAYQTMMLAIGWGCPPCLDHLLAGDEIPYNCDKDPNNPKTHEQLLEWCAQECEKAAGDLDARKGLDDKEGAYRVTKGFAYAVAGKAYLFAGNYANAESCLKEVIGSGKYALVDGKDFWQNFHIEGDGNCEKIFETNLANVAGDTWGSTLQQRTTWMETNIWGWRGDHFVGTANPLSKYSSIDGWGGGGVPKDFADEFIANDGNDSYRLNASIININDVIDANPARVWWPEWGYADASLNAMTKEQKLASDKVGLTADGLYGQSFYLHLKFIPHSTDLRSPGENLSMKNFTIMRYAEVLLMYAEALIQQGKGTEALTYINQIQKRANSQTISTSADMTVLEREKKLELWLEDCRWADMVRWNHLDKVKTAGSNVPWLYDKFTRAPQAGDKNVTWENGTEANSRFYIVSTSAAIDRGDKCGYRPETNGLFPYPYDAMSKNLNLVQNPGW